jgi:HEAT repeat protein
MMIDQLQNPDKNLRLQATLHLGRPNNTEALPALTAQLLREPDAFVCENITWAIVQIGLKALAPMLEVLRNANPTGRLRAAHVLSKLNDPQSVDALILALQDEDLDVVQKAAFALGQLGDARAIPALTQRLGEQQLDFRETILTSLERFGPSALPLLRPLLKHEHWSVREQTVTVMGFIADSSVIPDLHDSLRDPDWQVRLAGVMALGTFQQPDAQAALKTVLEDEDPRIRLTASRFLERQNNAR